MCLFDMFLLKQEYSKLAGASKDKSIRINILTLSSTI